MMTRKSRNKHEKKTLKPLVSLVALLLLLSCSSEPPITPEKITSLEYGVYIGFTGEVTKITIYPQKQVLQPDYRSGKTCDAPISTTEWNELTQLVDGNALKKVKIEEERAYPDAGAEWIIVRSNIPEIKAIWGGCTGGDPTSILPLINALNKRMKDQKVSCQ